MVKGDSLQMCIRAYLCFVIFVMNWLCRFSASDFTDLVFHLADLASTLRSFLTIYPPSIRELMRAHFIERVVEFYEAVVPSLQETWHGIKGNLRRCGFSDGNEGN